MYIFDAENNKEAIMEKKGKNQIYSPTSNMYPAIFVGIHVQFYT